jgi:triphosphatase
LRKTTDSTGAMFETELKFQVPAASSAAVARAVATASAERVAMAAAYFDTADRRLASAALALRLRREGRRWVQTLKGRGDGLMARLEHEVPVPGARPQIDPARHAGTPVGEQLLALLADGAPLEELYRTEIVRHRRVLRQGGAAVELAHDRGHIVAAGQRLPVDELEFELLAGPPAALVALAQRWVQRHGLWWDVRTKSERGFRLAEGLVQVPAVRAGPSTLAAGSQGPEGFAAMLRDALSQALPNGAELADGLGSADHLHQLRVGLRRLRTVLREASPWAAAPDEALALERDWAAPFAALGAARDADVLEAAVWPAISAALARLGLPGRPAGVVPPVAPGAAAAAGAAAALQADATAAGLVAAPAPPAAIWRGKPLQLLLLRTLLLALPEVPADRARRRAAADGAPVEGASTPAVNAAALLKPAWKRVQRGMQGFEQLDEDALHRLRRQCKRLRYLLEALEPQLRRKPFARLMPALRQALDRLGELNDLHTALAGVGPRAATEPAAGFAAGWLVARAQAHRPIAQRALARALRLPPPWR